uniref:Uncharacterized protein n=1 Tax=Arundo donax TaxID=35708 RepID=A0A0A9FF49_ARUDO
MKQKWSSISLGSMNRKITLRVNIRARLIGIL